MRALITIISILGALLFGSAFVLSYINPVFVESVARHVVRLEVERRVGKGLDSLEGNKIVSIAERLSGRNAAEIQEIKRKLAEGIPQRVAAAAAELRNPNCPCRKAIERSMIGIFEGRIADLAQLNERLSLLIRTKYMEVAASLTREFRIFSGANALVFALLGLTTLFRKRAALQLVLPTLVLLGAAATVAFLADIVFNRARICTKIVNVSLNVAGASIQAVPC